jgi:hypothetical protein
MPIVLEAHHVGPRRGFPLKFNSEWIKEEDFCNLIHDIWSPLSEEEGIPYMQQFLKNLLNVKKATSAWEKNYKLRQKELLEEVENKLGNLLIDRSIDSLQEVKVSLMKELMCKKNELLRQEESKWRQRSREIWI